MFDAIRECFAPLCILLNRFIIVVPRCLHFDNGLDCEYVNMSSRFHFEMKLTSPHRAKRVARNLRWNEQILKQIRNEIYRQSLMIKIKYEIKHSATPQ